MITSLNFACAHSLDWPLSVFNTGVIITCHHSSSAAVPGMVDAKQQPLSYLPPDDEQVCPPDCVLVSEDGKKLSAHEVFICLHSKELGKMLAVAKLDDEGTKSADVPLQQWLVHLHNTSSAVHMCATGTLCCTCALYTGT